MAISKILYMNDNGAAFHGRRLKTAIDYITVLEKTQGGQLIGTINCQKETAFEEMIHTKQRFGKEDKRQGYHLIISFQEEETSPDIALEITKRFVEQYIGAEYEAIYAVHDNTDCVHSHIVFNSVNFVTGRKYRYEKGDWEKDILPLINGLCKEYGLATLELTKEEQKRPKGRNYGDTEAFHNFSDMIKRDVDACIIKATSFESFLMGLEEKGYEIKKGKYLAIKPPGMERFRRCKTFGVRYAEESIRERIEIEHRIVPTERKQNPSPRIVRCRGKKYGKARLSTLQKRYYAKLYRTKQLKKKPYSKAYQYRTEIRQLQMLQKQYLFLVNNHVSSKKELVEVMQHLTEQKKVAAKEKGTVYREKKRYAKVFELVSQMKQIKEAKQCYERGDLFFKEEYDEWNRCSEQLMKQGHAYEELETLQEHYRGKYQTLSKREKVIYQELKVGKTILEEIMRETEEKRREEVVTENRKQKVEHKERKQPAR